MYLSSTYEVGASLSGRFGPFGWFDHRFQSSGPDLQSPKAPALPTYEVEKWQIYSSIRSFILARSF